MLAHLKEQAARAGLTTSDPWLSKVEQLLTMTQLKHGRHPLQCLLTLAVSQCYPVINSMYLCNSLDSGIVHDNVHTASLPLSVQMDSVAFFHLATGGHYITMLIASHDLFALQFLW